MNLSLCIVHFHSEEHLKRFLTSVFANPPHHSFEVIVVDNGSSADKMNALRQQFLDARWLPFEHNLGFGAALNRAVKEAKGDTVLLANSDLVATPFSIQRLMDFLKTHPKAGIVGPKLMFESAVPIENNQVQDSARSFPSVYELVLHRLGLKPRQYLLFDQDKTVSFQCDWLVGACLMMRRDLFLKISGFDERFFLFFEDTDLCRRVKEAGYEVWYVPDSVFVHTRRRLSESNIPGFFLFKKAFWIHVASAIKYFYKWSRLSS